MAAKHGRRRKRLPNLRQKIIDQIASGSNNKLLNFGGHNMDRKRFSAYTNAYLSYLNNSDLGVPAEAVYFGEAVDPTKNKIGRLAIIHSWLGLKNYPSSPLVLALSASNSENAPNEIPAVSAGIYKQLVNNQTTPEEGFGDRANWWPDFTIRLLPGQRIGDLESVDVITLLEKENKEGPPTILNRTAIGIEEMADITRGEVIESINSKIAPLHNIS
jgi:hypothetical protein